MIHPDDENGDVLRRMEAAGDTLTIPRDIDFAVIFREQANAEQFARTFNQKGFKTTVEDRGIGDYPIDVIVVKHMLPTYEAITSFEVSLQEVADTLDGCNDGWGCVQQ